MFFRVFFLYVSKIVLYPFASLFAVVGLSAVGIIDPNSPDKYFAFVGPLLILSGITCALLAVYWLFINRYLQCPHCRKQRGELVDHNKRPAIECDACGLVYVRSLWFDFDVTVIPWHELDDTDEGLTDDTPMSD